MVLENPLGCLGSLRARLGQGRAMPRWKQVFSELSSFRTGSQFAGCCRIAGLPGCRTLGWPGCWVAGFPGCRKARLPGCQVASFLAFKLPRLKCSVAAGLPSRQAASASLDARARASASAWQGGGVRACLAGQRNLQQTPIHVPARV